MNCRIAAIVLSLGPFLVTSACRTPSLTKQPLIETTESAPKIRAAVESYVRDLENLQAQVQPGSGEFEALGELRGLASATLVAPGVTTRPLGALKQLKDAREPIVNSDRFTRQLRPREGALWSPLGDLLLAAADPLIVRRKELFERKYFAEDVSKGSNLLEGLLNSSLGLTRSAQIGEPGWEDDTAGVQPWEVTVRLEPFARIDNVDQAGVLGALGGTYHLFPASADGDLLSNFVQRVGLRIGGGYLRQEGEPGDFVFGVGAQVRSLSVWGLWQPEESDFFLGIGASDFRWVSELSTLF